MPVESGENNRTGSSSTGTGSSSTISLTTSSDPTSHQGVNSSLPATQHHSLIPEQSPNLQEEASPRKQYSKPLAVHSPARTSSSGPSSDQKFKALNESDELRSKAHEQYENHNFEDAEPLYKKCLAQQKIAYGINDPRLIPTMTRLFYCARQLGRTVTDNDLDLALTMFEKNKDSVEIIEGCDNSISTWRLLGFFCLEAAYKQKEPNQRELRHTFAEWAEYFYQLALKKWEPTRRADYERVYDKYLDAAELAGDTARVDQLAKARQSKLPALRMFQSLKRNIRPRAERDL